ncbi:SatD family protein [Cyclobacterium qasimii]|uniref:Uncharacterized protein n=2 Tax=Cyclobacterium qasimii TaxID=1350429 RepID=S7WYT4_9BACT|nr:SatD family protein [Cyclobacterium qasimii]EPR69093.1 hypothetical protein ADICYQ_1865 [Cyclobacterium qasimii M12-11B]GEO22494.1 hypothetical protein CQA01_30280 [Cyclobacterium qasimii]
MIGIITGDLINSRKVPASQWMQELKQELKEWGNEGKDWEIYRGDSFQLRINNPGELLYAAILLKATIKSIDPLDIRMGLGIGEENFTADRLLENNGSAYVYSGEVFEDLEKRHQRMMLKSDFNELDQEINLMLQLALTIMDNWSVNSSKMVCLAFKFPTKNQTELGDMEGISQNSVSARLSRANFEVIKTLVDYFPNRVAKFLS